MELKHFVFLALWLFIMYRALWPRQRKRTNPNEPTDPVLDETGSEPEESRNETEEIRSGTEETYDFEALRKRIRESWERDTEDTALDLPDEMETPVYREPGRIEAEAAAEQPVPSPAVAKMIQERVRRVSEKKQPMPAPLKAVRESEAAHGSWGQDDARQWVLYDTVFGKPRALRPFRRRHLV